MRDRVVAIVAVSVAVSIAVAAAAAGEHDVQRPVMRQLPPPDIVNGPPGPRALLDARTEVRRRFRGVLAEARSGAGATRAAEALLEAAIAEGDRGVKWALLDEARRQAAAAGNALLVDRAMTLAAAVYEFDSIQEEYETLNAIPLRGIDAPRAAALAQVAERLSGRAEADGRRDIAARVQALALRGWQRAGDAAAARRAAERLGELDPERIPGRR